MDAETLSWTSNLVLAQSSRGVQCLVWSRSNGSGLLWKKLGDHSTKYFGKGVKTHHMVSVSRYFNRASRTSARVLSSPIASNALETIDV
jgi:hypothetical protein